MNKYSKYLSPRFYLKKIISLQIDVCLKYNSRLFELHNLDNIMQKNLKYKLNKK